MDIHFLFSTYYLTIIAISVSYLIILQTVQQEFVVICEHALWVICVIINNLGVSFVYVFVLFVLAWRVSVDTFHV